MLAMLFGGWFNYPGDYLHWPSPTEKAPGRYFPGAGPACRRALPAAQSLSWIL